MRGGIKLAATIPDVQKQPAGQHQAATQHADHGAADAAEGGGKNLESWQDPGPYDPALRLGPWEERRAAGKAIRGYVPCAAHAEWQPPADRPDPVTTLLASNVGRQSELLPLRMGAWRPRRSVSCAARPRSWPGIWPLVATRRWNRWPPSPRFRRLPDPALQLTLHRLALLSDRTAFLDLVDVLDGAWYLASRPVPSISTVTGPI